MIKKKRVVIFATTESQAAFAARYRTDNTDLHVHIVAPSITAQQVLRRHGADANEYTKLLYSPDYYAKTLRMLYTQAHRVGRYFLKHAPQAMVFDVNIVPAMQILLETEILEVLAAANLYQCIQQTWRPEVYLFPEDAHFVTGGWVATHFWQAAILREFFVSDARQSIYPVSTRELHPLLQRLYHALSGVNQLRSLPKNAWLQMLSLNASRRRSATADALMFSGGMNLYFYHSVFNLLNESPRIRIRVISSRNILAHEMLLRGSSIAYEILDETAVQHEEIIRRETAKAMRFVQKHMSPQSLQQCLPKDTSVPFKRALAAKLHRALCTYAPKTVRQIVAAEKLLKSTKPRLLITTHDPGPSALPFVYAAKKRRIPTLLLLHGFHDVSFGADHESDAIVVWGKLLKEEFVNKLKKKENTVHIGGYPFLDIAFEQRQAFWQTEYRVPVWHQPLRLSLLLTVYQVDETAVSTFLADVFARAATVDFPIELWIRTHPGQPLAGIKKLAAEFGVAIRFNEPMDIEEFVRRSDILVSWDTTAIIWAMLFGKPVFYTTPWWGVGHIPAVSYRAAWPADGAPDLFEKVTQLFHKPQTVKKLHSGQRKFIADALGPTIAAKATEKHGTIIEAFADHRV